MTPTAKQVEAFRLCKQKDSILLYGGSGSGKTRLLTWVNVVRALRYPNTRHIIIRHRFNAAKASIWLDTLPKVLAEFPGTYTVSETDHFVKFFNGSELWVDGLDNADRAEKMLGREYTSIYFNECSQLSFPSVELMIGRLRLSPEGCRLRAYYDCNPTSHRHWTHDTFIKRVEPQTGKPIRDTTGNEVGAILINPADNPHLPPDYIARLEGMTGNRRKRFLLGEWTTPEGAIFENWDIVDEIPEEVQRRGRRRAGLDYGFTVDPAALVDCYLYGDDLYVDELIYQTGLLNTKLFDLTLNAVGASVIIVADSSEPKSNAEARNRGLNLRGAEKGRDSVRAGIDWLLSKRIHVTRRSQNLIQELETYAWRIRDGKPEPVPEGGNDHAIDAIRYACEAWMSGTLQVFAR